MKTKRFLLIIGIALAAQAATLIPAGAVMTWSFSQVDENTVGLYSSLALNAGKPCISYYDSTNGNLMYASWNDAAWQRQTVDGTGDVGLYSSLALDTAGNPHIAYYDKTNGNLMYASWSGTTWQRETVDGVADGDVGLYPSLALDTAGNPRIAYYDSTNGNLKYAAWNTNAWNIEIVATKDGYPSLALDGDISHISYCTNTPNKLYYATRDATWNIGEQEKKVGPSTSLAF